MIISLNRMEARRAVEDTFRIIGVVPVQFDELKRHPANAMPNTTKPAGRVLRASLCL
jgi:hypothetical protein